MHVVIVGCGRVGSALARSLTEGGHTVAVIDKRPEAFARLPSRLQRPDHQRHRLRPRPAEGGRHRAGGVAGRGHERRQLEHPHRPGRPGDVRHRERRGPHLRPPAGGHLPAPRHRHRGHRGVDDGAGDASLLPSEAAMEWIDPSARVSLVERTIAGSWSGHPLSDLEQPGRVRVAAVGPARGGAGARTRTSSRRTATWCTWPWPATRWPTSMPRWRPVRQRERTDAGRHRRRWLRRALHRASSSARPSTRS